MELGFRLLGYRVCEHQSVWIRFCCEVSVLLQVTDDSGHEHVLTKAEAKLIPPDGIRGVMDKFLSPDDSDVIRETRREHFVRQLHDVRDLMHQEKRYRFIASSLLFSYGRPDVTAADEVIKVSMIDFAHTFHLNHSEEQVDQNYLTGLNCLLSFLETKAHVTEATNK
jgi:hypothetical protein